MYKQNRTNVYTVNFTNEVTAAKSLWQSLQQHHWQYIKALFLVLVCTVCCF